MIEAILVKSSYSREYLLYIYKRDGDKKYFAKSAHLKFSPEPTTEGMTLPSATFTLPYDSITNYIKDLEADNKALLTQKDTDKNDHIKNLNEIIRMIVNDIHNCRDR